MSYYLINTIGYRCMIIKHLEDHVIDLKLNMSFTQRRNLTLMYL